MAAIASKSEMYQLYHRGAFGNRLCTWRDLEEFYASKFQRPVVLRYKGSGGGRVEYGVMPRDVPCVVEQWVKCGADPRLITLNELANDSDLILQGEVMRSTEHVSLRYSTVPAPMRVALAASQYHVGGLRAVSILRSTLDPTSFDELMDLLDRYPDSVIEFSTWGHDVGQIPHRNTVFWEVRNY